jgi:hypothetical protein
VREDFVVGSDRVEASRLCPLGIGPVIRDRLGHPGILPQVIAARKGRDVSKAVKGRCGAGRFDATNMRSAGVW